jgi:hypothetical protein
VATRHRNSLCDPRPFVAELLSRTYCVVFHEKSLLRRYPLELLPFLVGALEVVANCLVIAIIAGHPFHPHWLVNIAGFPYTDQAFDHCRLLAAWLCWRL